MTGWIGPMIQAINEDVQGKQDKQWQWLSTVQARKYMKRDRDVAFAREDSALQRRVADARAAGVHPLFALGASVGGSPVFTSGVEPLSHTPRNQGVAALGDYLSRSMDRRTVQTHEAAIGESNARRKLLELQTTDLAMRMERESEDARNRQKANVTQDVLKVPAQSKEYRMPNTEVPYSLFNTSGKWQTSKSATAQQMEDEYGEVTDWTYGPGRAVHDWFWYNEGWKYFVPFGVYERLRPESKMKSQQRR